MMEEIKELTINLNYLAKTYGILLLNADLLADGEGGIKLVITGSRLAK
jgi:hypothetical protein